MKESLIFIVIQSSLMWNFNPRFKRTFLLQAEQRAANTLLCTTNIQLSLEKSKFYYPHKRENYHLQTQDTGNRTLILINYSSGIQCRIIVNLIHLV